MQDVRTESDGALLELPVLVPEARLAEFYAMLGKWYHPDGTDGASGERNARGPRASAGRRYLPLAEHLSKAGGKRVKLTLDQIDKLLEAPLPESARKFRTFWANSDTPQGRAWSSAGFRLADADLNAGTVVFDRV